MNWLEINTEIHNSGKSSEAFDLLCRILNEKKHILLVQRLQEELEACFDLQMKSYE